MATALRDKMKSVGSKRRGDDLFMPGSQEPLDQSMKQVAVAGIFNSAFCKSPMLPVTMCAAFL